MVVEHHGFDERFARLLQAILDCRVVPFVGAGFSSAARTEASKEFEPTVTYLNKRLKGFIAERIVTELPGTELAWASVHELFENASSQKALGQLAEIAQWLSNKQQTQTVLEELNVGLFCTLQPSDAHRYLAYLVREGLINEVITTNYDTCLETAYRRSFGQACDSQCKHSDQHKFCEHDPVRECAYNRDQNCKNFGVVHNLDEYRRHGARVLTQGSNRHPFLRIYKINGCAHQYAHNTCRGQGEKTTRILLTERELQDFGTEAWARDLLRDRARSRSLLFVGFGSAEPQIRHTVLALMEEFHSGEEGKADGVTTQKLLSLPNAPFLVAYESTLSFPQMQIMSGFVRAHQSQKNTPRDFLEACFGNVLTGCDSDDLGLSGEEKRLGADDFMRRLFQAAYKRLLERHSIRGSVFYRWLADHTVHPGPWREALIHGLYPGKVLSNRLFGRWPELLEPATENDRFGPCLLWEWLHAIRRDAIPQQSDGKRGDFYLALNDDSLLILVFLTLITALAKNTCLRLRQAPGIGLEIHCDALNRSVFLAHEQRQICVEKKSVREGREWILEDTGLCEKKREDEDADSASRLLFILDLPSVTHLELEGRIHETKMENTAVIRSLRVFNYVRVPVSDWVHAAWSPDGLAGSLQQVFDSALANKQERRVRMTRLPEKHPEEGA